MEEPDESEDGTGHFSISWPHHVVTLKSRFYNIPEGPLVNCKNIRDELTIKMLFTRLHPAVYITMDEGAWRIIRKTIVRWRIRSYYEYLWTRLCFVTWLSHLVALCWIARVKYNIMHTLSLWYYTVCTHPVHYSSHHSDWLSLAVLAVLSCGMHIQWNF